MALVFRVRTSAMPSGEMLPVSGSTSASTGLAPRRRTTVRSLIKATAGRITSSPGPTPRAWRLRLRAWVQLVKSKAKRVPQYSAKVFSNSAVLGPMGHLPALRACCTSSIAASSARTGQEGRRRLSRAGGPPRTPGSSIRFIRLSLGYFDAVTGSRGFVGGKYQLQGFQVVPGVMLRQLSPFQGDEQGGHNPVEGVGFSLSLHFDGLPVAPHPGNLFKGFQGFFVQAQGPFGAVNEDAPESRGRRSAVIDEVHLVAVPITKMEYGHRFPQGRMGGGFDRLGKEAHRLFRKPGAQQVYFVNGVLEEQKPVSF